MELWDALQGLEPRWSGPWHEDELESLPASPGLFCVCACEGRGGDGEFRVVQPIYIGGSVNVRQAVQEGQRLEHWRRFAGQGRQLCFGFMSAPPSGLDRMGNAMIAYYRPPANASAAVL